MIPVTNCSLCNAEQYPEEYIYSYTQGNALQYPGKYIFPKLDPLSKERWQYEHWLKDYNDHALSQLFSLPSVSCPLKYNLRALLLKCNCKHIKLTSWWLPSANRSVWPFCDQTLWLTYWRASYGSPVLLAQLWYSPASVRSDHWKRKGGQTAGTSRNWWMRPGPS